MKRIIFYNEISLYLKVTKHNLTNFMCRVEEIKTYTPRAYGMNSELMGLLFQEVTSTNR